MGAALYEVTTYLNEVTAQRQEAYQYKGSELERAEYCGLGVGEILFGWYVQLQ